MGQNGDFVSEVSFMLAAMAIARRRFALSLRSAMNIEASVREFADAVIHYRRAIQSLVESESHIHECRRSGPRRKKD